MSDSLSLTNFLINSLSDLGILFKRTDSSLFILSYRNSKILMR